MVNEIIFDGEGIIAGRLGARVAKELLKGNSVVIVNSEKVIVSGDLRGNAEKYKKLAKMGRGGSMKGPKIIRNPERLLKRIIRGMVPRQKTKGREAIRRLKCYNGLGEFKEEDLKDRIVLKFEKPRKYSELKDIARLI